MSGAKERKYNFIFEKLAQDPDDLVGLLAYGVYKREKIEYINNFKKEKGNGPSEEELDIFHSMSVVRVEQYRIVAETILAELQSELISDQIKTIKEGYDKQFKEQLSKLKVPWWESAFHGFLGSLIFTFFIGAIVVIMLGIRSGVGGIIDEGKMMFDGRSAQTSSSESKKAEPPSVPVSNERMDQQ